MIHFIIGTKAQFIKMAPLMHLMDQERRPYRVLNLGQHAELTQKIVEDFSVKGPISNFVRRPGNVETYRQAATWIASAARELSRRRKRVLDRCFAGTGGVALVHGDTASTLIGLHLAQRAKQRVGLVEAGLSSGSKFDPFPEEIIRRHCEKRAHLLFAPGNAPAESLATRKLHGAIVNTGYNTGRDALALTLRLSGSTSPPTDAGRYSVMTLHRLETLTSKSSLTAIIRYATQMAKVVGPIRFFLHNPTRNALSRCHLIGLLQSHPNIQLFPLQSYPDFVAQIFYCRYVLTDGGSVQEEASYLEKPCLILRSRTERKDGLDASAKLATYDIEMDRAFLERQMKQSQPTALDFSMQASRLILSQALEHDLHRAA